VLWCLLTWQKKKWPKKLAVRCSRILYGVLCCLSSGDSEDGSSFLRNVGNHLLDYTVPLLKLPQYNSLPLWKSQMARVHVLPPVWKLRTAVPWKKLKKAFVVISCNIWRYRSLSLLRFCTNASIYRESSSKISVLKCMSLGLGFFFNLKRNCKRFAL
jgi:hypothetical protein